MESIKRLISALVIVGSFTFFLHVCFPSVVKTQSPIVDIGGIPIQNVTYVELISEPFPYVIIYSQNSLATLSKNDYLKIREQIMGYNIIEIGDK